MVCPKCRAEVAQGQKFCGNCGNPVAVKCPQCGQENPPSNQFCGNCGAGLPWLCEACGTESPAEAKFCGQCGAQRGAVATAGKVDVQTLLGDMRTRVGRFIPESLAERFEEAAREPAGTRRNVTVLMADLTGFTSLSETLDAEDVTNIVNRWFEKAVGLISEYEGYVDKFQGDLVMALFGAPVAVDRAPERALRVAARMIETIEELNRESSLAGEGQLQIHVAINTGDVVAGEVGGGGEYQYTVMGDAVNVASRLVHVSEAGQVVVGEETYRRTAAVAEYEALEPVQVKGKAEALGPYLLKRLLAPGETRSRAQVMVGREREMEVLWHGWEHAEREEGQIVGIGGEAGVGKSTLAQQFCQRAEEAGGRVLAAHCFSYASRVSYLPLIELLRGALGLQEEEGRMRAVIEERLAQAGEGLGEWAAYFGSLLGVPEDQAAVAPIDARQRREATFRGLRALLFAMAERQPVVLVIDDLHWADETTVDFVEALVPRIANRRVLLVALFRPDFSHQWVRRPNYSHIGLERLGPEESEVLAGLLMEQRGLPERFKGLLVERSDGNPLFMGEIARAMDEQSRAHGGEEWEPGIPDTVEEILMVRIDGLAGEARQVLHVASVAGRQVSMAILEAVVEGEVALEGAVEDLVHAELLREVSLEGDGTYEFEHHLVQEVAYSHLLRRDRERLHLRVARALRVQMGGRTRGNYGVLAYHYEGARAWQEALRFSVLAALDAQANYAHADTLSFVEKALRAAKELPRSAFSLAWETRAHWALAHVHRLRGEVEKTVEASRRALQLARELGWPDKLALAYYEVGFSFQSGGDYEKAKQCFRAALREWERAGLSEGALSAHVALSACYYYLGRHDLNQRHIERAMEIADSVPWTVGVTTVMSGAYNNAGDLYHWLGDNDRALEYFHKALELAVTPTRREDLREIAPRNKRGEAWALGNIGLVHASRAEFEEAFGQISQALELASEVEEHFFEGLLRTDLAQYQLMTGRFEEALGEAGKAVEMAEVIGHAESVARALLALAAVRAEFNEQEEGFRLAGRAMEQSRAVGSQEASGLAHRAMGVLLRQYAGSLEEALGHLRVAGQLFRLGRNFKQEAATAVCAGGVMVMLGQAEQAARTVERALEFLRKAEARYYVAEGLSVLGRARGRMGEEGAAGESFAEALALAETLGCPPLLWRIEAQVARWHAEGGRAEEADEHWGRAERLVREAAAALSADRLREGFLGTWERQCILRRAREDCSEEAPGKEGG